MSSSSHHKKKKKLPGGGTPDLFWTSYGSVITILLAFFIIFTVNFTEEKKKELIEPIQNDIFNAIKEIAIAGNYAFILDASGGASMLYTDPKYDKSDEVLEKLGFKN